MIHADADFGYEAHLFAPPTSSGEPVHILLAEDGLETRSLLAGSLREEGYDVAACTDGAGLIARLTPEEMEYYNLIITDVRTSNVASLRFLEAWRTNGSNPPVILMTASGNERLRAHALRLGAAAVFRKPFRVDDLLDVVRTLI